MIGWESLSLPKNRLLASLSEPDYEQLQADLEPIELNYRQVLYQANQPIPFVYFLETGVASLVHTMWNHTMWNGVASEVGTIGNEGFVGVPVLLGDKQAPNNIYMQVPGFGLRMKSGVLSCAIEKSPTLKNALLHYTHTFFNQVAQSAACAHHHSLEQRCCRWLLMTCDRMNSNEFLLTRNSWQ